ncbi:MAG TPA: hypothetical protein VFF96_06360 [Pseudoxanthomonas sp.]|nr:hypothetical protein [Pseudoxanthomonas sp.]
MPVTGVQKDSTSHQGEDPYRNPTKHIRPRVMHKTGRILLSILSVVAALGAIWSALWFLASADLASGYCFARFSLFAEEFRCRQPDIALVLVTLLTAVSLLCGLRAHRSKDS